MASPTCNRRAATRGRWSRSCSPTAPPTCVSSLRERAHPRMDDRRVDLVGVQRRKRDSSVEGRRVRQVWGSGACLRRRAQRSWTRPDHALPRQRSSPVPQSPVHPTRHARRCRCMLSADGLGTCDRSGGRRLMACSAAGPISQPHASNARLVTRPGQTTTQASLAAAAPCQTDHAT